MHIFPTAQLAFCLCWITRNAGQRATALQINHLCTARAMRLAWLGCLSHRLSPTLQMACTDAVNQPYPDVPDAAHLGSACWEGQPRSAPSPGAAHRQPFPRCWSSWPSIQSHPAGKPRGGWKSLHLFYFPANVSSAISLLLTKQQNEAGAGKVREHPWVICPAPTLHPPSIPFRASTEGPPIPSPAFSFLKFGETV